MGCCGKKGYIGLIVYAALFVACLIAFGSILIIDEKKISDSTVHGTSHISQLAADWEQPPMTDIQVVTSTVCPTGYTDMFAQTYYGLSYGCDCTNICCGDMNGCDKFHKDTSCDNN